MVSSTTINTGGSQVTRSSGAKNKINLGAITFTGGSVNFGADNIAITSTTNTNGRLGTGLARSTVGGTSWAKNDGSGNIVGLADTDYTPLATSSAGTTTMFSVTGTLSTNSTTLGSLRIKTDGNGQSLAITGGSGMVLGDSTAGSGSGGLLFTGANDYTINVSTSNLRSANGPLIFQQWGAGTLTIDGSSTNLLGSNIEKHGTGKLVLKGTNGSTSTTATLITGGILSIRSNGSLGAVGTGSAITLNGGTLEADTTSASIALENAGANKRNITVGQAGGRLDVIGGNSLTVSGVISSAAAIGSYTAPLTLGSASTSGTLILSGTNTYTGGTILRGGTTEIQNATALGAYVLGAASANNFVQFTGGALRYGSTINTDVSQRIRYSTSAVNINTNGNSVSFASGIDYTNTGGLTKSGTGTLTLSGASTYTGSTTVSAGSLYVTGSLANSGVTVQADGTIGSNGIAGTLGAGLSINAGGNLDLTGATLGANSTGILNLTGGTLTLGALTFQDLVGWNWEGAAEGSYELIDGSFTINWGSTAYVSEATAYDFGNGKKGYFESGSLNAVIIPEPGAALLGGLGLLALLRRRR